MTLLLLGRNSLRKTNSKNYMPPLKRPFFSANQPVPKGSTHSLVHTHTHGFLLNKLVALLVNKNFLQLSGDSWMYPDPNVPLWEIPILVLYIGYLWLIIPKNPIREHNKYHGSTLLGSPPWPMPLDAVGWTRRHHRAIALLNFKKTDPFARGHEI